MLSTIKEHLITLTCNWVFLHCSIGLFTKAKLYQRFIFDMLSYIVLQTGLEALLMDIVQLCNIILCNVWLELAMSCALFWCTHIRSHMKSVAGLFTPLFWPSTWHFQLFHIDIGILEMASV